MAAAEGPSEEAVAGDTGDGEDAGVVSPKSLPSAKDGPLSDIRLGDVVLLLDDVPKYLRAMSLALRSVYNTSTAFVETFTKLQEDFHSEAATIKEFLVPLAIEEVVQFMKLLHNYTEDSFEVWSKRIDDTARACKEFKILFDCTSVFFGHMKQDLQRFPVQVKAVREALAQETLKFQREAGILSIRSFVKEEVFISLLFVPDVEVYAAPLVHGGEKHDFTAPVVAKDHWERALAAACTVEETLMPTIEKFEQLMRELANFMTDYLEVLEGELKASSKPPPPPKKRDPWADFGKTKEQIAEERRKEEEEEAKNAPVPLDPKERAKVEALRERHFEIFKPKAHWMKRSCQALYAVAGNIISDMEIVPLPHPRDIPIDWAETRKTASGEDLIDIARGATENVEIKGALEPGV